MEASVKEFFASKDKNWYQCRVQELAEKWFQMLQHDGLYFEFIGCFRFNLKNKVIKLAKYCKTFDSH